jgi:hypothetical protein
MGARVEPISGATVISQHNMDEFTLVIALAMC